ncbi:MAG: diguanylate cyclase, partial [Mycobacterium sp.]|nr:diguanylate cyclase [Mycobacterium sp.]
RIEAHRATRAGAPVGVVFLDLDGFKQVNDAHGHAVGDAPIRLTASVGWTCGSDDVDELVRRADANMYRHKARLRTAPEGSDTPVA